MDNEILYQNKKIFYRSYGSGKPVVLIHGFGEDGEVWNNQVEFLKDKVYLLVPDLPGSGRSEMVDDMSIEGMAEVIKYILDSESSKVPPSGGFRGALIGHSMGGYITLAFAANFPEFLDGFGLFHSTAYNDNEEKRAVRLKGISFIEKHGPFEFLKTIIPNFFSPQTKQENPQLIKEHVDKQKNFSAAALTAYYRAMRERPERIDILKIVKIPVLFVIGEYDNAIPLEEGLKQCHLPEMSYIHILKKSGHMGMIEEPQKTNRILEEFLLQP